MDAVLFLIYLVIGCYIANGVEYDDGANGFSSPIRGLIVAFSWPLLFIVLLSRGETNIRRGRRR